VVAISGAAIRRLRLTREEVDVVLGGGQLQNGSGPLIERIREGLSSIASRARITQITAPPVAGAALLGLDLLGGGPAAHRRIRRELTDRRLTKATGPGPGRARRSGADPQGSRGV